MNESNILNRLQEHGLLAKRLQFEKWVRCATSDHPKSRNGWYKISNNWCHFGNWAIDYSDSFFIGDEYTPLTPEQKYAYMEECRRIEREQQQKRIEEIQKFSNEVVPCIQTKTQENEYITKKHMKLWPRMFIDKNNKLFIPMYNIDKITTGWQIISNDGKKFKTGSILKNSFYPFCYENDKLSSMQIVFLVEGIATGNSLCDVIAYYNTRYDGQCYDLTCAMVVCCFSANNIDNVAKIIKGQDNKILIIAVKDCANKDLGITTDGFTIGEYNGDDVNDMLLRYDIDFVTHILHRNLFIHFGGELELITRFNELVRDE